MNAVSGSSAPLTNEKDFTSSILLWVRADQPRQAGMDYWKGPHSGIISATKGLEEYKPFCDNSHLETGFHAPGVST